MSSNIDPQKKEFYPTSKFNKKIQKRLIKLKENDYDFDEPFDLFVKENYTMILEDVWELNEIEFNNRLIIVNRKILDKKIKAFKELEYGQIGLIMRNDDGTISQIALTKTHSELINLLIGQLTLDKPLFKMPPEYNLMKVSKEEFICKDQSYHMIDKCRKECSDCKALKEKYKLKE